MKCPIDQAELVMSERQGVEIDYCPTCRGVWLDRGELDKIIDRVGAAPAAAPAASPTSAPSAPWGDAPVREPAAPSAPRQPEHHYGDGTYGRDRYDDDRYRGRDPRYDDRRDPKYDPRYDPRRKKKDRDWLTDLFDFG